MAFLFDRLNWHQQGDLASLYLVEGADNKHEIESAGRVLLLTGQNNAGKSRFARSILFNLGFGSLNGTFFPFQIDKNRIMGDCWNTFLSLANAILEEEASTAFDIKDEQLSAAKSLLSEEVAERNVPHHPADSSFKNVLNGNPSDYMVRFTLFRLAPMALKRVVAVRDLIANRMAHLKYEVAYSRAGYKPHIQMERGKLHRIYMPLPRGSSLSESQRMTRQVAPGNNRSNTSIARTLLRGALDAVEWPGGRDPDAQSAPLADAITAAYFAGDNANRISVVSGEKSFSELQSALLGDHTSRSAVRMFEEWLGKSFFFGQDVTLMAGRSRRYISMRIGRSEELELPHLGDGIQQLIAIFWELWQHRFEEALVVIEEPETNLHPALQRSFVKALYSPQFLLQHFVLVSHSNHLVDAAMENDDATLLVFRPVDPPATSEASTTLFEIRVTRRDDISWVDELGASPSSVLGANSLIWVEGVTEVPILRRLLSLEFSRRGLEGVFREDIHYSFVRVGGSQIKHLTFEDVTDEFGLSAKNVSRRSVLIVDGDFDEDGKPKARYDRFKTQLEDRFVQLSVREIEHLVSSTLLKKIMKQTFSSEPKDTIVALEATDRLGIYLDENFAASGNRKTFRSDSGSLKDRDKVGFARAVYDLAHSIDDFDESGKELGERLVSFVVACNPQMGVTLADGRADEAATP